MDYYYLIEWCSIANIVIGKEYQKTFKIDVKLQKLDEDDEKCNKIDIIDCENEPTCTQYTNSSSEISCIPKKRIGKFSSKTIIISKFGEYFKIFYTEKFEKAYVYILFSKKTKVIYILWSSGEVLDNSEINSIDTRTIIELIKELNKTYSIVLCGHSLGCVLSEYLAIKIVKHKSEINISNIYLFGSAPFSWMNEEELKILKDNYEDRIHIFVIGYKDERKKLHLDPFFFRNLNEEEDEDEYESRFDINQYYPIEVLEIPDPKDFQTVSLEIYVKKFEKLIQNSLIKNNENIEQFPPNRYDYNWSGGCPLHEWIFYSKCFISYLQNKKRQIKNDKNDEKNYQMSKKLKAGKKTKRKRRKTRKNKSKRNLKNN